MKSTQLLSVVLSLIMVFGVSAGSAFAQTDDVADGDVDRDFGEKLASWCEMTDEDKSAAAEKYGKTDEMVAKADRYCTLDESGRADFIAEHIDEFKAHMKDRMKDKVKDHLTVDDFGEKLSSWCEMTDEDKSAAAEKYGKTDEMVAKADRYCTLDESGRADFIAEHIDEFKAHMKDRMKDKVKDHLTVDDFGEKLSSWCEMTDEDKSAAAEKYGKTDEMVAKADRYCTLDESGRADFIAEHIDEFKAHMKDRMKDKVKDHLTVDDFGEKLASWCEMTDEDKSAAAEKYGKTDEMVAKADRYCTLDESDRADFIAEHIDEFKAHMKDRMKDKVKDHLTVDDFGEKLASWCEMTDEDKSAAAEKYGKTDEMVAKADRYCTLDESDRADFIAEHIDEFRTHMKDRMMYKAHDKPHMDYDRLCALGESERAAEIDDSEKLDRLSKWCEMSAEEREEYKKEHYDAMKDKVHDKMSDVAKDKMKMKLSDKSDRLKAMIMDKHDISDERREEIKMKYIEKHGDLTDEKKSELKMKFKDHMKNMRMEISDEQKSSIHDRLAEMKAFKAELRDRASEMTDEEKQELRAEFIEKAKSMQLAWISPRTQMTAGVDSAEVECREGFSLVMKASNGVAMCLKADTALRMIDRGLVVPAN